MNCYSSNDWVLSYLCRTEVKIVAGMYPVEVSGIENIDITDLVDGHNQYQFKMKEILERADFVA